MKKLLLVSLLFCGGQVMAAPHLSVGDNLTVLAAKSADVSIFSDDIALKDGTQRVVVKYDSPENPSSTNQSNGRVTSKPYLLTFNATGDEKIELTTKAAVDTSEVRALAKEPVFILTKKGKAVPFSQSPLIRTSTFSSVATSWESVVNGDSASAPAATGTAQTESGTMQAMQKLYLQSSPEQRKAFLKWALDVQ